MRCIRKMLIELGTVVLLCVVGVQSGSEVSEWRQQREIIRDALFQPSESTWGVELLKKAASQGNIEAESDLTLVQLLGIGLTQDIEGAAESSFSLAKSGGARAHTTQGFLLSHNLTGKLLTDEERQNQALSHYMLAAINKDPLAQIIVARHYLSIGDCEAALQYIRKAAGAVLPTVGEEMTVNVPPRYVWPEDDVMAILNQLPSLDEQQFLEYEALNGDAEAALKAAVLLFTPIHGLKYDPKLAMTYLRQAAEANSTTAMIMLAAIYLHKNLVPDKNDTFELLQKALDQGEAAAHTYLGLMYLEGFQDISKDLQKAKTHLEEGVKVGSVEAFYLLGKLYDSPEGPGRPMDALPLWEISAAFGHVPSVYRVAEKYNQKLQIATLSTVTPDGSSAVIDRLCQNALPLYRMVALSGKWHNLHQLAYNDYVQGYTSSALMKYLLLSDLGYAAAHVNTGRILDTSPAFYKDEDTATNEAVKIWQRAAEAGTASGHLRLGDLYYYGVGIPRNLTAAAMHYSNAAQLGSGHGMFSAAQVVEWGEGVSQNLTRARDLYEKTLATHSEAVVPVTLALFRMDMLLYFSYLCDIDLYSQTFVRYPGQYFLSAMPEWDICIMTILGIVIISMTFKRLRQ